MKDKFLTAVCQLRVDQDKTKNIDRARSMIAAAARDGARLVVLPEMFNCPYQTRKFPLYAEHYPTGESINMLSQAAREGGVYLVGGSIPERDGDTVYNTSFVFDPQGRLLGRYRKAHLFDVELSSGLRVQESSTLGHGDGILVLQTDLCNIGVAICYDIRFPELIRLLALRGAHLVVIPAAFNMTTGPAHWDLVFRGRAVDNQVYVAAASPARDPEAGYVAYGHSMLVDPWGNVVARAAHNEEIIRGEVDLKLIDRIRSELPLLRHRRTDMYELREK